MEFPCLICHEEVSADQEAFECDSCSRRQHRVCGIDISSDTYWRIVKEEEEFEWNCHDCSHQSIPTIGDETEEPIFESPRRFSQTAVQLQQEIMEQSIADNVPSPIIAREDELISYYVKEEGTQRGKKRLTDSLGFSYSVKRVVKSTTYWSCSIRNKKMQCMATVIQKANSFEPGRNSHVHPAKPGITISTELISESKKIGRADVFKSAPCIVENKMSEKIDPDAPIDSLPSQANIVRAVNRARQKDRPRDPNALTDHQLLGEVRPEQRPNILFIVVDDLRPALGCYGYPNLITPNIDQLASRSVLFTKAYAQQALCGPSRTSFLTSRRPETTRIFSNTQNYWRTFSGNFTTLPQVFKENGYFTTSVGKIFHPGRLSGHSDDYPYSWSQPPYHPSTEQYKQAKVCPGPGGNLYTDIVCPVKVPEQPEKTLPDIQSTEFAIQFLHNQSAINNRKPFFLAVGLHKPHIPLKYPDKYLSLYPISEIHLAKHHTLPPKLPSVAWNPWQDLRTRDDVKALNVSFPYGPLPLHYQLLVRQSYYAATSYLDDLIGRLLSTLDSLGFANNTIISFIADHGWSLGEHQEWSKFSNYDVAVRVPLMVYVPGVTTSGDVSGKSFPYKNPFDKTHRLDLSVSRARLLENVWKMSSGEMSGQEVNRFSVRNQLVELVDIFPSLCDLANITTPPKCPKTSSSIAFCTEGSSFADLIKKGRSQTKWKSAVFSQYPRPSIKPENISDQPHLKYIKIMGYSIRTQRYRYTEWVQYSVTKFKQDWSKVYGRELYDQAYDSSEDNNVCDDPKYAHTVHQLSALLHSGWKDLHTHQSPD